MVVIFMINESLWYRNFKVQHENNIKNLHDLRSPIPWHSDSMIAKTFSKNKW